MGMRTPLGMGTRGKHEIGCKYLSPIAKVVLAFFEHVLFVVFLFLSFFFNLFTFFSQASSQARQHTLPGRNWFFSANMWAWSLLNCAKTQAQRGVWVVGKRVYGNQNIYIDFAYRN